MDNFREWLSDNLRYILLGLGIVAVVLILFFGIRFLSDALGDTSVSENVAEEKKEDAVPEVKETPEATPEPTAEEKLQPEEPVELEKNTNEAVQEFVEAYYTALGNRDVTALKTMVDSLGVAEESAIVNSHYIEGYGDIETYVRPGLTENSYVVLAAYNHKYVGYDTTLVGVSCMYLDTDEDGDLYIVAEPSQDQEDQMDAVLEEDEIRSFLAEKQTAYEQALASDSALNTYLDELGADEVTAMEAENGSVITVKENCNVRKEASETSEKLGELVADQQVTKTGQEGDWIQISFDGETGYVRGDLFR